MQLSKAQWSQMIGVALAAVIGVLGVLGYNVAVAQRRTQTVVAACGSQRP